MAKVFSFKGGAAELSGTIVNYTSDIEKRDKFSFLEKTVRESPIIISH